MSAADLEDELEAVKRELEDVKKQLAVYQATANDHSKTNEDRAATTAFHLLDLPRELRDAIYELCVVPGKVFIYHDNAIKTSDMRITPTNPPEVQVFLLCKQVNQEARQLFMEKNLFVLTSGPCTKIPALHKFLSSVDTQKLRRISLSFDYRDYAASGVNEVMARQYRPKGRPDPKSPYDPQLIMLKIMERQMVTELWYPQLAAIRHIELEYLQLSLQNCREATGTIHLVDDEDNLLGVCCLRIPKHGETRRPKDKRSTSIRKTLMKMPVKFLDVVGTLDGYQRDRFSSMQGGIRGELQFHGGKGCVNQLGVDQWDEEQEVIEHESRVESAEDGDDESEMEPDEVADDVVLNEGEIGDECSRTSE